MRKGLIVCAACAGGIAGVLAPVLAQEVGGEFDLTPEDATLIDGDGPAVEADVDAESDALSGLDRGYGSFDDFRRRIPQEVSPGLPSAFGPRSGGPVAAGPTEGGLRVRLRLEQRFGTGQNLGLEIPEEGRTSLATTAFDLGVESENEVQKLSFVVGGSLRFGDIAEGNNTSTGLTDPRVGLRYVREGANAQFNLDGFYRESDIALTGPVWSFLDAEGDIILPRDYSFLQGSGQRQAYGFNAVLDLGRDTPLGVLLTAGANGVNYQNSTAGLSDYDQTDLGITPRFRFNSVTTGVIDLGLTNYKSGTLERETTTYEVGFDRELDSVSTFGLRLGTTDVKTTEFGIDTTVSGPSGSINYNRTLSNGQFSASYQQTQNQDGNLATLSVFRSLDLPNGSLSGSIGVAKQESADPQPIGSLTWRQQGATGSFDLSFNRYVGLSSDDEYTLTNVFAAGYTYEINAISSLRIDVGSTLSDATAVSNKIRRANAALVYSRELTDDWQMNAGLTYSLRDETTVGRADSNGVFFTIGRNFDLTR